MKSRTIPESFFAALLFASSLLMPGHVQATVTAIDHIVAIVNDEVITRQELALSLIHI